VVLEFLAIPAWILLVIAVAFIAITLVLVGFLRKFLVNTVVGLIALILVNWLGGAYGIKIGINFLSVLVTAVLGLAGVGLLILLHLAGLKL